MTPMMTAMNSQQQQIAPVGISQQQQIAPVGIIDMSQSSNKLVKRPLLGGPGGARPDAIVPPLPRGHASASVGAHRVHGAKRHDGRFIPSRPPAPRFARRGSTGATQPMLVPQHLMQRKKGETMTTTMTTTPTKDAGCSPSGGHADGRPHSEEEARREEEGQQYQIGTLFTAQTTTGTKVVYRSRIHSRRSFRMTILLHRSRWSVLGLVG